MSLKSSNLILKCLLRLSDSFLVFTITKICNFAIFSLHFKATDFQLRWNLVILQKVRFSIKRNIFHHFGILGISRNFWHLRLCRRCGFGTYEAPAFLTDDFVPLLCKLVNLRSLDLQNSTITSAGLESLCTSLTQLRSLELVDFPQIYEERLGCLLNLTFLRNLTLNGLLKFTDVGLAHILKLVPQLDTLYLQNDHYDFDYTKYPCLVAMEGFCNTY